MSRVAFVIPDLKNGWLGGTNYLRNLLWAIDSIPQRDFDVLLLAGRKTPLGAVESMPGFKVVRSSLLDRMSIAWLLRRIIVRVTGSDLFLDLFLRFHGVSLFSHGHGLGALAKVKTIGWIPDLQHRHLPKFFSEKERFHRDQAYEKLLKNCDHVVVSSETARQDVQNFYASYDWKVSVLHFAVRRPDASKILPLFELEELYGFNGDFVYIPNQFWIHKNHSVVVAALAALGETAPLCLLTGATEDYRHPEHFSLLIDKVNAAKVSGSFRVLGVLPYEHVVSLMHYSRVVLNPSLFEGWSTTVEEAKAMDKPLLLSDIPVHREQAPVGTIFFSPNDPQELANALSSICGWLSLRSASEEKEASENRFLEYGRTYQTLVSEVLRPKDSRRTPSSQ